MACRVRANETKTAQREPSIAWVSLETVQTLGRGLNCDRPNPALRQGTFRDDLRPATGQIKRPAQKSLRRACHVLPCEVWKTFLRLVV